MRRGLRKWERIVILLCVMVLPVGIAYSWCPNEINAGCPQFFCDQSGCSYYSWGPYYSCCCVNSSNQCCECRCEDFTIFCGNPPSPYSCLSMWLCRPALPNYTCDPGDLCIVTGGSG